MVVLLQIFVSDSPASTNCPKHNLVVLYMQIMAMIYLLEKPIFHNNALSSCYLLFKLLEHILINQEPAVLVSESIQEETAPASESLRSEPVGFITLLRLRPALEPLRQPGEPSGLGDGMGRGNRLLPYFTAEERMPRRGD